MNFLEKDLETIIWENYERCAERGLDINQDFYIHGEGHRQLNLAPYGIADLVYIRYHAHYNAWYIQVLELKKGKIDTAAYFQAKRYQTALISVLERVIRKNKSEAKIYAVSVLIGNELEQAGDFVFGFNTDHSCRAFLYSYGFDGISFKEVGKEWRMTTAAASSTLDILAAELGEIQDSESTEHQEIEAINAADRLASQLEYGDYSQALLITPEGVLLNEDLLDEDLSASLRNGAE